jgi:hypothetical protein
VLDGVHVPNLGTHPHAVPGAPSPPRPCAGVHPSHHGGPAYPPARTHPIAPTAIQPRPADTVAVAGRLAPLPAPPVTRPDRLPREAAGHTPEDRGGPTISTLHGMPTVSRLCSGRRPSGCRPFVVLACTYPPHSAYRNPAEAGAWTAPAEWCPSGRPRNGHPSRRRSARRRWPRRSWRPTTGSTLSTMRGSGPSAGSRALWLRHGIAGATARESSLIKYQACPGKRYPRPAASRISAGVGGFGKGAGGPQ